MRKAIVTAVAAALITAPVVAGTAAAATTSSGEVCELQMTSLTANNLLNDGGSDYVWVKLDQTFFPSNNTGVKFTIPGENHPASSFENPRMGFDATGLHTWVVVDTWGPNTYLEADAAIACKAVNDATMIYRGGGAIYTMNYNVT